jgi:hypothetical protein
VARFTKSKWGTVRTTAGALAVAAIITFGVSLATQRTGTNTFRGEIQDSECAGSASHADTECTLECVRKGAQFVLYDSANNEVYRLDDQMKPGEFAGQKVILTGTLDASTKTIHVLTINGATVSETSDLQLRVPRKRC